MPGSLRLLSPLRLFTQQSTVTGLSKAQMEEAAGPTSILVYGHGGFSLVNIRLIQQFYTPEQLEVVFLMPLLLN